MGFFHLPYEDDYEILWRPYKIIFIFYANNERKLISHKLIQIIGFPYDLSVLRIYTSLLVPSSSTKIKSASIDLVNHVKEFISRVPYLAEPLTESLLKNLSPRNASLYPQLTSNIEKKLYMQVVLNKPRTVMTVNSKITSSSTSLPERNNIFSGVYLVSGTQGYVDQGESKIIFLTP